ncbi:hypothetical protein KOW79_012691 [Hemibagrus wyckioides]|uniref:Uncharacterized protein n=1 Tax=Hemibagrus wyckioides TaxID=337641 RepID=A0A9D3NPD2_9TELE|nr:uncharacterized protein LOC131365107 [Hemibagrus wyckioides]KAG7324675.1 hypothetical protein KOW79_012691 [Hemibagrus wyckioides]
MAGVLKELIVEACSSSHTSQDQSSLERESRVSTFVRSHTDVGREGLAHSLRSNSSQRCSIGLRSGLCAGLTAEMAEFEAIAEGVEEAIESVEGEIEELPEETQTIIRSEIAETRAAVEELSATESNLKKFLLTLKDCVFTVAKFTAQNVMIGTILWGVNVTLNKLFPHSQTGHTETHKRMSNVIKALSDVISTEAKINQKALDWMKAHKDDTIFLDGIEVPMEAVLSKHLIPIVEASEKAEAIADSLQETVDGKIQFKCPTAYNMKRFMEITEVFIKAFNDLVIFIKEKEEKVKELQTFPVKEEDLKDLTAKLYVAMALPLWDD